MNPKDNIGKSFVTKSAPKAVKIIAVEKAETPNPLYRFELVPGHSRLAAVKWFHENYTESKTSPKTAAAVEKKAE